MFGALSRLKNDKLFIDAMICSICLQHVCKKLHVSTRNTEKFKMVFRLDGFFCLFCQVMSVDLSRLKNVVFCYIRDDIFNSSAACMLEIACINQEH